MSMPDDAPHNGLTVTGLTVSYGGDPVVDSVSLTVPLRRITGLIGPNGAGKTTTFNACDGLVRAIAGSVVLLGQDVTTASTGARARAGLGRTFQRVEVCQASTVATNVALGREARLVGARPLRQLLASRGQKRDISDATEAALNVCGITHLAQRKVVTLSTGQRRLVELARVLAGGFEVLLLDEPSSGLDEQETRQFGDILTKLIVDREVGILLVEHDVELVMATCSYLYVLDFGRLIFEGTPGQTRRSDVVRSAYLGDESGLAQAT